MLQKPWVQARLTETNRELTDMGEGMYRIPLTDENVCVFLAEDKRCLVEVHEGLTLKPHECQRFPFASIRMPDGSVKHESSAACKNISEKLLLAFQPILPKPAKAQEESLQALQQLEAEQFEDITQFPDRVGLGLWGHLSLAEYQAFQSRLRDIFMQPDLHPEAALKQAQALLNRRANIDSVSQFRFRSFAKWALGVFFLRKPYRSMSWASLLGGGEYHDPRIFGLPIHLRQQDRIPWNPAHNHRLNAFLYALLQRKRLLSSGGSLSSLFAMAAMACLLVQWHAKTIAWLQQNPENLEPESIAPENTRPQISAMDVSTAIRLVERYYTGHHPRFMHFFISRWKGCLVETLLLGLGRSRQDHRHSKPLRPARPPVANETQPSSEMAQEAHHQ